MKNYIINEIRKSKGGSQLSGWQIANQKIKNHLLLSES